MSLQMLWVPCPACSTPAKWLNLRSCAAFASPVLVAEISWSASNHVGYLCSGIRVPHHVSSSWILYFLPKLKVWEGIWQDSIFPDNPPVQKRQLLLKTLILLSELDSRQGCDSSSITWVRAKPRHEVVQWPQQGTAGELGSTKRLCEPHSQWQRCVGSQALLLWNTWGHKEKTGQKHEFT